MKWTACAATAALIVTFNAGAAPVRGLVEKSPDVLAPAQLKTKPAEKAALPLVLAPTLLAAAPTIDEVGDVESFGKNVIYLGLAQTLPVTVTDDCTGSDPTLERCLIANAAPGTTTFDEAGLATMSLPAKASKSLLCFTLTPFIFVNWQNSTGAPQLARFSANADITIANPLLNDPALIDPNTGPALRRRHRGEPQYLEQHAHPAERRGRQRALDAVARLHCRHHQPARAGR